MRDIYLCMYVLIHLCIIYLSIYTQNLGQKLVVGLSRDNHFARRLRRRRVRCLFWVQFRVYVRVQFRVQVRVDDHFVRWRRRRRIRRLSRDLFGVQFRVWFRVQFRVQVRVQFRVQFRVWFRVQFRVQVRVQFRVQVRVSDHFASVACLGVRAEG